MQYVPRSLSLPLSGAAGRELNRRALLVAVFSVYAVTWVALPLWVNDTLNRDTIQIVYWGREWQLGYFKHPPLVSWLAEGVRLLFGPHDIAVYLTSQAIILACFLTVHRMAALYLAPWQAFMAVTSLTIMGYYSFIIPNLNHNVLIMLPWCLTILLAHRAMEERKAWAWPALGLVFGLGILAKYTILILAPLILAHMLIEPRHRSLLTHWGPWLALAVGTMVASPHLLWLVRHDLASLHYMAESMEAGESLSLPQHLAAALTNLAKMAGMCGSLLVLLLASLGRPRRPGFALTSSDRMLVLVTLGPAAIVVGLGLATGTEIRGEWASPFFFTLPILLLRLGYPRPSPVAIRRFLVGLRGLTAAMAATYGLIFTGLIPQAEEAEWSRFPARALAATVAKTWAEVCDGPVPVIIGDSWLAGTSAYLLPGQPRVYAEADPGMSPWLTDSQIRETGAVMVWNQGLPRQFRDLDHQNEDESESNQPGWFPGQEVMESRFGAIHALTEVELPYGRPFAMAPARLGLAVIPPERPCR